MQVCGIVRLHIDIKGKQITHKFHVMKNCSSKIIAGLDFMSKFDVTCNYSQGIVSFGNNEVSVPFIRKQSYLGIAYLCNNVRLFQGEIASLRVRTKRKAHAGEQLMLQALSDTPRHLKVFPTLNKNGTDSLQIRVRNCSNRTIHFKRFGPICSAIRIVGRNASQSNRECMNEECMSRGMNFREKVVESNQMLHASSEQESVNF